MNIQFGCVFYELLLGKHGEYLMSEVSKFLIEEYDNTNHKINEINYSIRGLDIDIDSIDNIDSYTFNYNIDSINNIDNEYPKTNHCSFDSIDFTNFIECPADIQ